MNEEKTNDSAKKRTGLLWTCFRLFKGLCTLVGAVVIFGFIGIQFIPVENVVPGGYSNPPVVKDMEAPEKVETILRKACYDCHSHEVKWPWYSHIAPVSFLVAHDVKEGREAYNFSKWPEDDSVEGYTIFDVIDSGEMPPDVYTIMHPEAILTDEEKAIIEAWANGEE